MTQRATPSLNSKAPSGAPCTLAPLMFGQPLPNNVRHHLSAPASAHRLFAPASAHHLLAPASAHHLLAPASAHHWLAPASAHQAPASAHHVCRACRELESPSDMTTKTIIQRIIRTTQATTAAETVQFLQGARVAE